MQTANAGNQQVEFHGSDHTVESALPRPYKPMISDTVLEHCRNGDEEAWCELIRVYHPVMYRYAYSLCHNHEDAADVVGDAQMLIYRNLQSLRDDACFQSWLFSIVRHSYQDICIRPRYRREISLNTGPSGDTVATHIFDVADPKSVLEKQCIEKEMAREVQRAIRSLPRLQRNVMTLFVIDEMPYEKICEETGLRAGTVKSRLNRARKMVRERFEAKVVSH